MHPNGQPAMSEMGSCGGAVGVQKRVTTDAAGTVAAPHGLWAADIAACSPGGRRRLGLGVSSSTGLSGKPPTRAGPESSPAAVCESEATPPECPALAEAQ